MKKIHFAIFFSFVALTVVGQSQPDNLNIAIFDNGTHGSNSASGAHLEFALKTSSGSYTTTPAAEDFILYLLAPKTYFSLTDTLNIVQLNSAIYGSGGMAVQAPIDLGGSNICFPVALKSPAGMKFNSLNDSTWLYAFTISFSASKSSTAYGSIEIIDNSNNSELTEYNSDVPLFTNIVIGGVNQLDDGTGSRIRHTKKEGPIKSSINEVAVLFPNPANSELNLRFNSSESNNLGLIITDINGRTVKQQRINVIPGSNTVPVDISKLASGIYIIKIACGQRNCETIVAKFRKQ